LSRNPAGERKTLRDVHMYARQMCASTNQANWTRTKFTDFIHYP
jgi:hypothetical protein